LFISSSWSWHVAIFSRREDKRYEYNGKYGGANKEGAKIVLKPRGEFDGEPFSVTV
jgi:hypothetical protein